MMKYKDLNLKQLQTLAKWLGQILKNHKALIGLIGPLGSGKTTFIQAFAKNFGIKRITSPTFVIAHEYKIRQGKLYHLDFYRLHKSKQLIPVGLDEMLNNKNIVLVEWVDRFPKIAKHCDILITLKVRPNNKRDVTIRTKK